MNFSGNYQELVRILHKSVHLLSAIHRFSSAVGSSFTPAIQRKVLELEGPRCLNLRLQVLHQLIVVFPEGSEIILERTKFLLDEQAIAARCKSWI